MGSARKGEEKIGEDISMIRFRSEYLTMRLCLAEVAWTDAIEGFRQLKGDEKIQRMKKIELLAWEISRLKEGKI